MNFVIPVLALAGLTLVAGWAWWCMTRRPERWARWVDGENDFWRDRGLVSAALAEKMKRWEKGSALKLMAALTTCIGAIGVLLTMLVLAKAMRIEHQKLRLPYNPALHLKPKGNAKSPTPSPKHQ